MAGCEGSPPGFDSVRKAIIAGTPITGDPAIMALLSFQGARGARCTATLISPRLLIAAAHCITETPGFQRHIFPGINDRNGDAPEMLAIKQVVPNPAYGAPRQGNDFSIIVLEAPLAIPPMRLNRTALTGAQGKTVRYVGYGISVVGNLGSGGVKRQNTAPLAQVSQLLLTIATNANQSCEGDSGGPLLLDLGDGRGEVIIGINSFVDAPACRRNSFFQRVDTQLAWIDEQIKKYDPDGMLPSTDGGAGDSQATVDAALGDAASPPLNSPDAAVTPGAGSDAQAPASDGPPALPATSDAGGGNPGPARGSPDSGASLAPTSADDGGGGCRYGGAGATGGGGGLTVLLGLMLAWIGGRRRRCPGATPRSG